MTGKYEVVVKDVHIQYKFTVNRNITILRGDSATGKTNLIDMIFAFQTGGISSGVTVLSKKPCVVLSSLNWQLNLSAISDSIVFIDEGDAFIKSKEFAECVQQSDNYYVIATRNALSNLPYSIKEIYGIKNKAGNKYQGTKRLYSEFYNIYKDEVLKVDKPDLVIVEDSNSAFDFYKAICDSINIICLSAGGKSSIYNNILNSGKDKIMVIADGAAFGPEIERVLSLSRVKKLIVFLPESFEWLVLKSDLIDNVAKELEDTADYVDSQKYVSWERFFTSLLIERTKGTYLSYKKNKLNPAYLNKNELQKIIKNIPVFEINQ